MTVPHADLEVVSVSCQLPVGDRGMDGKDADLR